jgi:UDP-N-acetylmuramyl tripeptide synthase
MRLIALWLGKITYLSLKTVGRRGAALPGLLIEKLFPNFLSKSLLKLPEGVVIITGTNGKTTSTKMLTHVLKSKKRVLTNPTGSNFVRGIVATVIQNSDWLGNLPYDIAVFELDEAYAAQFVKVFKPRATVVLNVMRDQMDRFGEIDHTARLIQKVVKSTTDFVVLNRDDPRVLAMARHTQKRIYYFGVASDLRDLYRNDDELHKVLPIKTQKLKAIAELEQLDNDGSILVKLDNREVTLTLKASGTFNAQNAIAVCAAAMALDINVDNITTSITQVKPAFGRGETIKVDSKKVILQLVKNPGGFRHALLSGSQISHDATIIAINDDYADGRDVSWLWDVSFKSNAEGLFNLITTSGTRATDMALRLKYDDILVSHIEPNLVTCLEFTIKSIKKDGSIFIYTTYTAMLDLRKQLAKLTEVEKV